MNLSNQKIAKLLKEVAAAYTIKKIGNIFQIRAYETAADAVENATSEIKDLWEEGKLDDLPGLGKSLQDYLDELFKTGKVKHFAAVKKGIPEVVFEFLDIPGVGPKTALQLAKLRVKDLEDLKKKIQSGTLVARGFSSKIAQKILQGMEEKGKMGGRMLLPYAFKQAEKILEYLKTSEDVEEVYSLGSLRRMVATIGDLDFSVSSNESRKVIEYFTKMPGVTRIVNQGENKATVMLRSGTHIDLLVGDPNTYGALLQHFTGSKQHNIHLRTIAEKRGFSLSEYGMKKVATGKIIPCETEDDLYKLLNMQTPVPEIREDTGEIEAAMAHKLPSLIELKDIKGDLHIHSNYPIEKPSHGPGADSIEQMVEKAKSLGYQFIGISDHSPSPTLLKERIIQNIEKRTKFIHQLNQSNKSIRVLNGLEIDILNDGSLSVPDEVLATLDYCIAGIHSGHRGSKEQITKRLISALESLHVDIIAHPTNRLLNERDSSEADWEEIFKAAAKNNKILEINAYPNRLDLRDDLVRQAKEFGVKFMINTDAHALEQMDNMPFGVAVVRRGWASEKDIINTWDWKDFVKWFKISI